jgi:hypothetical protein
MARSHTKKARSRLRRASLGRSAALDRAAICKNYASAVPCWITSGRHPDAPPSVSVRGMGRLPLLCPSSSGGRGSLGGSVHQHGDRIAAIVFLRVGEVRYYRQHNPGQGSGGVDR